MTTDFGSDSDSLSSSSGEEFLTIKGGKGGGNEDREAIVRKKLLQSFYGADAVQQQEDTKPAVRRSDATDDAVPNASQDEDDKNDEDMRKRSSSKDLDSPYFAHEDFVRKHVIGSSVHDLLETEERLALQVRTLDSTMQTLVYENYSKFIDATDAIKSIGVSCSANEDGLAKLSQGMQTIDEQSRDVEDALGSLRDAVAEKLRVKRLLSRLDALLKLPTTLQHQIEAGKFRLATKSYLAAHSILRKHSDGFESLKTIETECLTILSNMVLELKRKLTHWSGMLSILNSDGDGGQDEGSEELTPPKSMSEIFEAAGTLFIVRPRDDSDNLQICFDSGLSQDELKSMALAASRRLLDRTLDAHHIQLQEAMFSTAVFEDSTFEASLNRTETVSSESDASIVAKDHDLIPGTVLDNVLEAATLFGISFGNSGTGVAGSDQMILLDFISESFSSFLGHVRSVLLERQALQADALADGTSLHDVEEDEVGGEAAYIEISGAMSHLLRSVRAFASGLALPEVGIDIEFASSLVDQALEVTEAMVRRRVSQKFFSLRLRVVEECLGPFTRDAISHSADREVRVTQIVQMASVALSDGMQMVDDTIRSVLTGGVVVSSVKGVDYETVKAAVRKSCQQFALWLASTLERLTGLESSDPRLTIETQPALKDDATEEDVLDASTVAFDGTSIVSDDMDLAEDKVELAFGSLLANLDQEGTATVISDFTLAVAEMCRLAERSVAENMNQSIQASGQDSKRAHKSSGIFQTGSSATTATGPSILETLISDRFRLSASRVLTAFAMTRGFESGTVACEGVSSMALVCDEDIPRAPRQGVCQLLEITKMTCLDCAHVFGGEKRANPAPDFVEQDDFDTGLSLTLGRKSFVGGGAVKGLQLDVERMFMEIVPVFPHPLRPVDFTRNDVVVIVLKVAFRAMLEQARSSRFTRNGLCQLQIDVAFLRHMIPHFVADEIASDGINGQTSLGNLLDDVLRNAAERCLDEEFTHQDAFTDENGASVTPYILVRNFFSNDENDCRRFIVEE